MQQPSHNDLFRELFERATPRKRVSLHAEREIYASLHAQWLRMLATRRFRRRLFSGLAASLLLMLALGGASLTERLSLQTDAVVRVASLDRVLGTSISVSVGDQHPIDGVSVTASYAFMAGQVLRLGENTRVALTLAKGGVLRLDEHTVVQFAKDHTVELLQGRIYFDSGFSTEHPPVYPLSSSPFRLTTAMGDVEHAGTQFFVEVSDTGLQVAVREGKARLLRHGDIVEVETGRRVNMEPDGQYRFDDVDTYGEPWVWTEQIVASHAFRNTRVIDFLRWVSRETGRHLRFAQPAAKLLAEREAFVGTVDRPPLDALNVWAQTIDLKYELKEDEVIIGVLK